MDIQPPKAQAGLVAAAAKKPTTAETGAGLPAQATAPADGAGAEAAGPSLRVSGLTRSLLAEPAVDSAKVARLASQVRDGSYKPDPQKIAAKMLSMEQDLP